MTDKMTDEQRATDFLDKLGTWPHGQYTGDGTDSYSDLADQFKQARAEGAEAERWRIIEIVMAECRDGIDRQDIIDQIKGGDDD